MTTTTSKTKRKRTNEITSIYLVRDVACQTKYCGLCCNNTQE